MGGRIGLVAAALAAVWLPGCGSTQGPLTTVELEDARLRDVGEVYRIYQLSRHKPPRSIRDLMAFADATPSGLGALRKGEVIVRWGATLPEANGEPTSAASDEVLAYVKTVPEKGGPVLLLDGRTRHMSAEEFKAAKLAGTK
jgi:hypothetical protein